eukprot:8206688-Ditylum_brightwellii.AAC.1
MELDNSGEQSSETDDEDEYQIPALVANIDNFNDDSNVKDEGNCMPLPGDIKDNEMKENEMMQEIHGKVDTSRDK